MLDTSAYLFGIGGNRCCAPSAAVSIEPYTAGACEWLAALEALELIIPS